MLHYCEEKWLKRLKRRHISFLLLVYHNNTVDLRKAAPTK